MKENPVGLTTLLILIRIPPHPPAALIPYAGHAGRDEGCSSRFPTRPTLLMQPAIPAIHQALPSGVMCIATGSRGSRSTGRFGNAGLKPDSLNSAVAFAEGRKQGSQVARGKEGSGEGRGGGTK